MARHKRLIFSAYTCNQVVGYTVPSWYGAGGWGTLGTFVGVEENTTLAQAWYLNNQFILHNTTKIDPRLLNVRFDGESMDYRFQASVMAAASASLTATPHITPLASFMIVTL